MAYSSSDDVPQSKFSGAMMKVIRLNNCWNRSQSAYRNGDFLGLNFELDLAWVELEADSTNKQVKIINGMNKSIAKPKKSQKRWTILLDKWKFLMRIEKYQGLGKKYIDETEDELI